MYVIVLAVASLGLAQLHRMRGGVGRMRGGQSDGGGGDSSGFDFAVCVKALRHAAPPAARWNSACPPLLPDPRQLCHVNRITALDLPPPQNVTAFCAQQNAQFARLLPLPLDGGDDNANSGGGGGSGGDGDDHVHVCPNDNDAAVAFHCDTRLKVIFIPRLFTQHGIPDASTPSHIRRVGPVPRTKVYEEDDIARMPSMAPSGSGGVRWRVLCVPDIHVAVRLMCRKRNLWWYIPDFLAELRLPDSVFSMKRYTSRVGWVEYLCSLQTPFWSNEPQRCFEDTNLVTVPRLRLTSSPPATAAAAAAVTGKTDGYGEGVSESTDTHLDNDDDDDDDGILLSTRRYNVIAIQLDSLSRYQAVGIMSRLEQFFHSRLYEQNTNTSSNSTTGSRGTSSGSRDNRFVAFDMVSHNAYSDDTMPNIFAAFLGVHIYSMSGDTNVAAENARPGAWWHFAKRNGYTTFYGAMSSTQALSFGKAHYFDFGSNAAAADHVVREAVAYKAGKYGYRPYGKNYVGHCIGGKPAATHLFDHVRALSRAAARHGRPFAAQLEDEDLHNSNLLNARMIDAPLTRLLAGLETDGRWEDTVVLLNADHGARYGKVMKVPGLRSIYNANPVFRLLVPPALAARVGHVIAANQHVITHSLDVYATLRHLVGGRLRYRTNASEGWQRVRGLSVFDPLPQNRSCSDCGIPPSRCTCLMSLRTVLVSDVSDGSGPAAGVVPSEYRQVWPQVVDTAVRQLRVLGGDGKIAGCPVPHLLKVVSAEVQRTSADVARSKYAFLVYFRVKEDPSAEFKATVPAHQDGPGRYSIAPGLVGKRLPGFADGHKAGYMIPVDRTTAMRRSCADLVLAAGTAQLRALEHVHCVC